MKITETSLQFKGALTPRRSTGIFVVHHMAGNANGTVIDIHGMHRARGWSGCGYHYFIRTNGMIERGRPENMLGAHAIPANSNGIGICLAGDFTKHDPSEAQLTSLVWLIKDLWKRYPGIKVVGHGDIDATQCPGNRFTWARIRRLLTEPADGAATASKITVQFNGRSTSIPTRITDGRTEVLLSGHWVQLRALIELIPGAEIPPGLQGWNPEAKTVNILVP